MHLEFGVHLQEYVGEGAAEVAAVEVVVVLLRDVRLLASWTEHLFKKGTLTREMRNESDMPSGSSFCRSQSTRGQAPNSPFRYFSFIFDMPTSFCVPRVVMMKRAWISP